MDTENVKMMGETLAESLDSTQKNATNIEKLVQQVQDMSCKSIHEDIVKAILKDERTCLNDKLDLIHQENADYDKHEESNTDRVLRMQETQTENIGKSSSWWSENWGWLLFGGLTLATVITPGGRHCVSGIGKQLIA